MPLPSSNAAASEEATVDAKGLKESLARRKSYVGGWRRE